MDKKKGATITAIVIILFIISLVVFFMSNGKYKVTFDSNGGTAILPQTVKSGEKAEKPKDPTRSGYEFVGWYIKNNTEVEFDFNTEIKSDITLIAQWKEKDKGAEGEVVGIRIESAKEKIDINEEINLTLKIMPEDIDKSNLTIVWESSDNTIAKVDSNGKVKALKAGKVTITAKVGEYTATFEITVNEPKTDTTPEETTIPENTENSNDNTENETPAVKPTTKPSNNTNNTKPVEKPSNNDEPVVEPTAEPTAMPTEEPVKEETYTYMWEKIVESVAGQYRLYIVNSEGEKVSGTATVITKSGTTTTVSIPTSGVVYVKDAIESVTNVKAN